MMVLETRILLRARMVDVQFLSWYLFLLTKKRNRDFLTDHCAKKTCNIE